MANRSPDADRREGRLVLVVDDSAEMRSLIQDVLTEAGYEVVTASSGGSALSLLAERVPGLVITDLLMPGMDGFTLRSEMLRRAELARVPVIVLSGFWQRPSETLDVAEVITKPLEVDALLSAVKRAIGSEEEAGGRVAAFAVGRSVGSAGPTGNARERRRNAGGIQHEA